MASPNLIVLINPGNEHQALTVALEASGYEVTMVKDGAELFSKGQNRQLDIAAIISVAEVLSPSGVALFQIISRSFKNRPPYFIVARDSRRESVAMALKAGISDVFEANSSAGAMIRRIQFVISNWTKLNQSLVQKGTPQYRLPADKRLFDIVFSSLALLLLSPLLLLVVIAIRLESKGPVFYYSLRVGTGYRIFRFYKFRSMYQNADQRLKDLKHLNQYSHQQNGTAAEEIATLCPECTQAEEAHHQLMYADNKIWCEQQYRNVRKTASGSAFIKIKDDPRVTRVGKFLRNTSIDELPQLVNVLLGDMSIVGNRPLPLYEAEQLTTDKYIQRFIAPAGITGLWQVEKRGGKGAMSEEERLELDNQYARDYSLGFDLRLILRTIPALFQKENV